MSRPSKEYTSRHPTCARAYRPSTVTQAESSVCAAIWASLVRHVLEPLGADLATYFGQSEPPGMLRAIAKYSWTFDDSLDWESWLQRAVQPCNPSDPSQVVVLQNVWSAMARGVVPWSLADLPHISRCSMYLTSAARPSGAALRSAPPRQEPSSCSRDGCLRRSLVGLILLLPTSHALSILSSRS